MRILFMGTPDFAAASMKALIDAGMEVAAAVSQPDKPKGRGHKLLPTEVKALAMEHGIPVYQPEKIRGGELKEVLDTVRPDVIVVTAYGKILPPYILEYPKYGCVNVHASLLPKYRGAAPIQWAIVNGETETGVTTMLMNEGLDTGDMLLCERVSIREDETAAELFDRLALVGGELIVKTLKALEDGTVTPAKQDDAKSTYAPMISRQTGIIDWKRSSKEISDLVRGMYSWPLASTTYKGERLSITRAYADSADSGFAAGEIISVDKGRGMRVACGSGTLYVKRARFPSAKEMDVEDYARGHNIEIGTILE